MSGFSSARKARRLSVVILVGILLLATSQGADAASRTVRDATGDTYEAMASQPVRDPTAISDITSVTTAHTAKKVTVTIRARDLAAGTNAIVILVKAPGRVERYALHAYIRQGGSNPGFGYSGADGRGPGTGRDPGTCHCRPRSDACNASIVGSAVVLGALVPDPGAYSDDFLRLTSAATARSGDGLDQPWRNG
jgi:hypothetical protein